ncbi:MAG TPA: L,D-transpeptidase family protein [Candidatus Acidoferrum sp.]|nr:L,D-transpeptidase family protein [Candidatus Acidoferrum sp.]
MPRRPKPKYKTTPRKKRGAFRWLLLLIIIGCCIYFVWRHGIFKKTASRPAPKAVVSRPAPQPFAVTQQSPSDFPRPPRDVFEAQVALARRAISPGSIDGAIGSQTRAAISVFQETENLPITGQLDADTHAHLVLDSPVITTYTVTTNDLASLQPLGKTWLAKSEQSSLAYETELQLVAEKSHSNPLLIQKLNPNVNWTNLSAGTVLKIPDVNYPDPGAQAAFVVIHLSERYLEAFDNQTNLLLHFPCSIAAKVDKRPVGELHVTVIIQNPNYTVDPELFPESGELQAIGHKLVLPPGPKNPVGVAWIGLDKPGYGMHGTPNAELVGRTESHGCFRLANWDAAYLSQLVWVGMPVEVEP